MFVCFVFCTILWGVFFYSWICLVAQKLIFATSPVTNCKSGAAQAVLQTSKSKKVHFRLWHPRQPALSSHHRWIESQTAALMIMQLFYFQKHIFLSQETVQISLHSIHRNTGIHLICVIAASRLQQLKNKGAFQVAFAGG